MGEMMGNRIKNSKCEGVVLIPPLFLWSLGLISIFTLFLLYSPNPFLRFYKQGLLHFPSSINAQNGNFFFLIPPAQKKILWLNFFSLSLSLSLAVFWGLSQSLMFQAFSLFRLTHFKKISLFKKLPEFVICDFFLRFSSFIVKEFHFD